MLSMNKDLNSEVLTKAAAVGRLLAGGTGDATKITGASIDRAGAGNAQMYQSAVVTLAAHAVLGASANLQCALEYQTSADASSWDTAVVMYAATAILTDGGSGGAQTGQKQVGLDLSGLKRYVRFNPTPDLSAANTDTAEVAVVAVLGGGNALPAT